jgi:aldose 1-epimerase
VDSLLHLRAGALSLGVCPARGASIAYFRHNTIPILRDTPAAAITTGDGRLFSAFPLIPYSNRIRAGAFTWGGTAYQLGRDAEDPRHALHGTSRFAPWAVTRHTETYLRCALEYSPQNLDWPFAFHAWQVFMLHGDRLRIGLGLRNIHHAAAPAGLGLHPYFARVPGAGLRFDAAYVWAKDDQDIPTRSFPDSGRFNFEQRHAIEPELIDNDYGGWGGVAEISAPGRPVITLKADKIFNQLVLYTPEQRPYFAAEPLTHRPDAINPNGDLHDSGMTVLQPGEALEGVVEIMAT